MVLTILFLADNLKKEKLKQHEIDLLANFVFPLGAKRSLDFANFFHYQDKDLANLKSKQAELFGLCHTLTVEKEWNELSNKLHDFSKLEKQFYQKLMEKN